MINMLLYKSKLKKPDQSPARKMDNIQSILSQYNTEVSIDTNGKITFTIRAASRLLNITPQTLSENLKCKDKVSKMAEKLITQGFQVSGYNTKGIPDTAMALIIEYYAFDAKKCTQEAKNLYRAFASIGIRTYFQKQLGWEDPNANIVPMLSAMQQSIDQLTQEVTEIKQEKEQQKRVHPIGYSLVQDTSSVEMTTEEYLIFNNFSSNEIQAFKHTLARRAAASQRTGTGEQLFDKVNSCNKLRYSYLDATAKSMGLI